MACSAKTSPTGRAMLVGEVTIVDCLVVGKVVNGFVTAPEPPHDPYNFLFFPERMDKHQIPSLKEFPGLSSYRSVYAWVLTDPVEYKKPKRLAAKKGCVVWVNLT